MPCLIAYVTFLIIKNSVFDDLVNFFILLDCESCKSVVPLDRDYILPFFGSSLS